MAHVAFFVVRVVLERNFHRMAAAFKSKLEGFVGHGSHRHLKPVVPFLSPLAVDKTVVTSSLKIIFRTIKSTVTTASRTPIAERAEHPAVFWPETRSNMQGTAKTP